MRYRATKTYGHDIGLSCAFRQWRADSHCQHLHGYALAFTLTFGADKLDDCGWVIDFGGLKAVRHFLCATFDHRTAVALDDPMLEQFRALHADGIADVVALPRVGCEAFAQLAFDWTDAWLGDNGHAPRVRLLSVECREHGANSAARVAL